jgi:hypothetical protein
MNYQKINTYHVSGMLERETLWEIATLSIYQNVDAISSVAAVDSFEKHNWLWLEPPTTWLVTEAMKMEAGGQPTLFPLPPIGLVKTYEYTETGI